MSRHAGLLLPLFSAPSRRSWGLGELPDLAPLADWLASAGFDRLMLLPLGTMADGETSPYAAMSSLAIEPRYIALDDVPDFAAEGGIAALSREARETIRAARSSARVEYAGITRAKREALELAFERFVADEWSHRTLRAAELAGYVARERWWLDDYALYRAIAAMTGAPSWRDWPDALRDREPRAVDQTRRQLARDILRHQYWQWIAESQWQRAKRHAREAGVLVFGDLPFMVSADGPEVWTRPGEVMFDVSLGVPPDAFSETGQDWGLPTYNWPAIGAGGYQWIRARARRMAALFDGYRIDHLVGLYRTFGRPIDGEPYFSPSAEDDQVRQGEQLLEILTATGAEIIAEDLGLVPDFVRDSLARLGVPGCKVLRWERRWADDGQPFIDPAAYPPVSAAMTGTHDTETLAGWWEGSPAGDRAALFQLPAIREAGLEGREQPFDDRLRDAILRMMYGSGSNALFLPAQDVFGWRDRINTPGTVGDHNWTWRLPWPVDALQSTPEAVERARFLRALSARSARCDARAR